MSPNKLVLTKRIASFSAIVAHGFIIFVASGVFYFPASPAQAQAGASNAHVVVGHWRKTTIQFESPVDDNLVLHPDGTAQSWTATASGRTPVTAGLWRIDGNILTLAVPGGGQMSQPFFIHEGQLVYPNIENRRGFWERVGR
ncbi:MAG TPA: hypothetical protein VJM53_04650 [Burkholderiales bacterium]|nr:hypothetical protein [Burkholderiales bacterium]